MVLGHPFRQRTDSSGNVTLTGAAGTWNFVASKTYWQASSWSWDYQHTTTKVAWLLSESPLSSAQVASYAYAAGFRGGNLVRCRCGFGMQNQVFMLGLPNVNSLSSVDRGLWQVNDAAHGTNGIYDPWCPATITLFTEALSNAKTIVWNGPMGVFEIDAFGRGTAALVHSIANSYAMTIVGGGDTDVAVHKTGESDKITFISTGGGASLELLEGKILSGDSSPRKLRYPGVIKNAEIKLKKGKIRTSSLFLLFSIQGSSAARAEYICVT